MSLPRHSARWRSIIGDVKHPDECATDATSIADPGQIGSNSVTLAAFSAATNTATISPLIASALKPG